MRLTGDRLPLGRDQDRSNPWRMLVYVLLIAGGLSVARLIQIGQMQPLFLPTPTPTRQASSFAEEAAAHFSAGNLQAAIMAYQQGTALEPDNAILWAELARVQTYSSDLLTTFELLRSRLAEARASIDQAIDADEDSARAHAIRALVYDWAAAAEVVDKIGIGDQVRVSAAVEEDGRLIARRIEISSAVPDESLEAGGEN